MSAYVNAAHRRRRAAFTLLEVICVVAILLILVAMLTPAARLLRKSAKCRLAQAQELAMVNAIRQYRDAYGRWPGQTQDGSDTTSTNCLAMLADLTNNPRNVAFVLADSAIVNDCFMDPWGRPYVVATDDTGDGITTMVSPTNLYSQIVTNVLETVAVASWGPDPIAPENMVYSWLQK